MYERAPSPGLGPLGWLVGLAGYGCVRQLRSRYIDRLGGGIEDPEHAIRCLHTGTCTTQSMVKTCRQMAADDIDAGCQGFARRGHCC